MTTRPQPTLSKETLLLLRRALRALLCAIDEALRENYGWTERGSERKAG